MNKFRMFKDDFWISLFFLMCITAIIGLISQSVFARNECKLEVDVNVECDMTTPVLDCVHNNITIYNPQGNSYNVTPLNELGTTNIFNFSFLNETAGVYTLVTCDDYTRRISVEDTTDITKILVNHTTISSKQDSVESALKDNFTALTTLTTDIGTNISSNFENSSTTLNNIFDYLINTIFDWLTNTLQPQITDIQTNMSAYNGSGGFTVTDRSRLETINETTSDIYEYS